ncbi:MAG TPA: efflux RND transporter periplasmic adaptor subunit [Terriglobales bacterium]|nr:efflux RND transporter periplasmic adaptor subunit [Terriglobales bacterium]
MTKHKRLKRSLKRTIVPLISGTAAIVLTACSHEPAEKEPVVAVQTALAVQKPIEQVVSTEAVLFPLKQAALTPKVSAPVRQFFVQRGGKVHAGQLLAVLENRDLAAATVENRGAYEQAQAAYESATKATLPEEWQKAELDVQAAKDTLDAQQKIYESRKNLLAQGAIARKDVDAAEVAYVQARNAYEIAQKHQTALQSVGKQQELKSAAGQLTSAKGKYMGSEAQFGYTEIRSPISGVITDRPLYAGEMAPAGTPLITVMDTSQVVARAHVPEEQAALLKPGDHASITAPGISEQIPGTVTIVSPATDPNSTTVEIWVQAANPAQQLRPGTTVQLSIVAQRVADATVIPASALLKLANGGDSVMRVGPDQRAHQQEVQAAIRQGNEVQIVSGLKAGDRVVTNGAYGLPDNTKVQWNTTAATESKGAEP